MKYRLEGVTIEAIDTYVRVTVANVGCAVTKRQIPKSSEVANLLAQLQGYYPNKAQMQACARAAADAHDNKIASELDL